MRILHVSDLHLGRGLGELSREAEQRALVQELVAAATDLDVAATILAGDVFDAFTPPAWAEDLFFQLIDGLADGGQRAVLAIAGNHDSGARLAAADPLARRLGIVLAGDVDDVLRGHDAGPRRVRVEPLAPQVVRIEVPRAGAPIVAGLMPFLSEARVSRGGADAALADEHADSARYARRLAAELDARAAHRRADAVNLLVLHQYVTGGIPSESERRLRIGAVSDCDASAIPAGLDYVAIGHLHRPQEVVGAASRALYAGSPIAYSFSEVGHPKRAVLVDAVPGRPARLEDVPLRSGRPLEIWTVRSIDEARDRARAAGQRPIVDVRIELGRRLTREDTAALFELEGVTVASVRDLFGAAAPEATAAADADEQVPVAELFRELWLRRHGEPPDEETLHELDGALLELGGEGLPPAAGRGGGGPPPPPGGGGPPTNPGAAPRR